MKKVIPIIILLVAPLTLHAQVFIYGLVKSAERSDTQDRAIYSAIDETLMDGLFENGFVCFNAHDEKEFQLETALYAAKTTGSKYVVIWQVFDKQKLQLMLYGADGIEYKDEHFEIDINTITVNGNIRSLSDRYVFAVKQALPKIITRLRKG